MLLTPARLYDELVDRLGQTQVFMDVEAIEAGADFATVILEQVRGARPVLAVVSPGWAVATGARGGVAWMIPTTSFNGSSKRRSTRARRSSRSSCRRRACPATCPTRSHRSPTVRRPSSQIGGGARR